MARAADTELVDISCIRMMSPSFTARTTLPFTTAASWMAQSLGSTDHCKIGICFAFATWLTEVLQQPPGGRRNRALVPWGSSSRVAAISSAMSRRLMPSMEL